MNFAAILQLIELAVGLGETVVPLFIHNPKSQKITGIVITDINTAMGAVQAAQAASTPAQAQAPMQVAPGPLVPSGPK